MTGFTDYTAKLAGNWVAGAQPFNAQPAVWLALFTVVGIDAGTGFTEVSGGSYARVQVGGTATVNGTTASGNPTLHFAATPAWIVAGMYIYDITAPAVIPAATTVLSTTGTTVTMSANAAGAGVGATDVIAFSAFSTATASGPTTITNNAVITFAQATVSWGTVVAWGLYDAVTSGNLLLWDYIGNFSWLPCTVSVASPGVILTKAHGYSNGDSFVFSNEYGGTAPGFSAGNYTGILTVAGVATDSFNVTGVNTNATGDGMVRKIIQQPIAANVTASFAVSSLVASFA